MLQKLTLNYILSLMAFQDKGSLALDLESNGGVSPDQEQVTAPWFPSMIEFMMLVY